MRRSIQWLAGLIFLTISIAVSASNPKIPDIKRFAQSSWYQAISRTLVHSNQTTITRMVQDSIAFFDFSNNVFVPGAIISVTYLTDGRLVNQVQTVLNTALASQRGFSNEKTLFTLNEQGFMQTLTSQSELNGVWINKNKTQFNPYLGLSANTKSSESGQGFYLSCSGQSFYIPVQSMFMQQWDAATESWVNNTNDTVVNETAGKKVLALSSWDTVSASFKKIGYDTLFFSGNQITKTAMTLSDSSVSFTLIATATYDAQGNETEEREWNNLWGYNTVSKILQTFDSRNNLLSSIQQDSTNNGWTPLDSCPKMFFTYSNDNTGLTVSRTDSTWNSNVEIMVDKHFFKYQTFQSATLPRNTAAGAAHENPIISHNGFVKTACPVTIRLYSAAGKQLGETIMNSSGAVWKTFATKTTLSKGMYLAKIDGIQKTFRVWHE